MDRPTTITTLVNLATRTPTLIAFVPENDNDAIYIGHSLTIAIPGSAGLLSGMQLALNNAMQNQVKITRHLRRHLHEFAMLAATYA